MVIFSKLVLPEVKLFIANNDQESLKLLLEEFFPQDIAEIMDQLDEEEMNFLFKSLPEDLAVEVFSELDYPEQEDILEQLNNKEKSSILNEMAPDDRTELFEDMPDELVDRYINSLSPEEQTIAKRYMAYPEDSVARLSTPDFIKLPEGITAGKAIEKIREDHHDKEMVYYSYVIDNSGKLEGVVSLKNLILAPVETKIDQIYEENIISIDGDKDQEEAANLLRKYDLIALPVIGSRGDMIGIVTFDDLVDIVDEEAAEDMQIMAAMLPSEDDYLDTPFIEVFKNRVLWLIVLLVMQTVTGMVLKNFSSVLDQVVALSFFIPLLIGTGGNAGTQSSTLVIRGMATGDIDKNSLFPLLRREILLALTMGVVLGVLTFIRVYLQEGTVDISFVVSIGLLTTMVVAMLSGTILPVFFKLIKLDPALMSGPFISTSIDIIGLVIYLQIAKMFLTI